MIKRKLLLIFISLITIITIQIIWGNFNIVQAVNKIKISSKSKTLYVGYGMKINMIGTNKKKIKWTSTNPKIVYVSDKGYITAKSEGTAYIKTSYKNKKYQCKVTVKKNAHVDIYNERYLDFVGTSQKIKYKSSNSKIASIDNKGKIKAKKTGKVTIYAIMKWKTYSCTLIVDANGWVNDNKGNIYYFKGKKAVEGWNYINGYKYYFFKNCGILDQDVADRLKGKQEYYIHDNRKQCKKTIFAKDGNKGFIIPVKSMSCSVGTKAHATPTGTFYTKSKARWAELMLKSYGQYCTRIFGSVLFHSIPGNFKSIYNVIPSVYNKLGSPASHGCIRLTVGDAKWIYDNCKLKTKVTINDKSDGCKFNKPKTAKLKAGQNYDPTDPAIKKK